MVKTIRFMSILLLLNAAALYPSEPNPSKPKRDSKQTDYKLKKPSFWHSAARILGHATQWGLSAYLLPHTMPCKIVGAQVANRIYPDAYKGALPTASTAEKSRLQSALTIISYFPLIFVGGIAAYGGWQEFSKDRDYRGAVKKKKTLTQLKKEKSPEAEKIRAKYYDRWEKITTKGIKQIIEEDDEYHAKLWVKQHTRKQINAEDGDGKTALHCAIDKNKLKVAKVLADSGAKIDGFSKLPSLLSSTTRSSKAHELIRTSRANCCCCHED